MAEKIVMNKEIMQEVSHKLNDLKEVLRPASNKMNQAIQNMPEGWKGEGRKAFVPEYYEITDAFNRLVKSITHASKLAKEISQDFSQVDEEA